MHETALTLMHFSCSPVSIFHNRIVLLENTGSDNHVRCEKVSKTLHILVIRAAHQLIPTELKSSTESRMSLEEPIIEVRLLTTTLGYLRRTM